MVKDKDLKPIHPGEILKTEFLAPLHLKEEILAQAIQVQPQIIHQLIQGRESMTVDLAYRLYFYFGVSTEYWLNFQKNYDLATYQELAEKQIKRKENRKNKRRRKINTTLPTATLVIINPLSTTTFTIKKPEKFEKVEVMLPTPITN